MVGIEQWTPRQAKDAVDAGALLLDVREDTEWAQAHVPDAVHMPMGQVPDRLGELSKDVPIVVVCHSGARSQAVAGWLHQHGFVAANLAGGIVAWHQAGLPVER